MTLHYHGTPITPRSVLERHLSGRLFCVSFAAPDQVALCHRIGQSVMLDNGAYSQWRRGLACDWPAYYAWTERWLEHSTTWAVIPDVVGGGSAENDALLAQWPHGRRGAPVWHLDEPLARLAQLCGEWPLVCLGSAGEWATVGDEAWKRRMDDAMVACCDSNGRPRTNLHMLRGAAVVGMYPFHSVDSTNVARNHHLWQDVTGRVRMIETQQAPVCWVSDGQTNLFAWTSGDVMTNGGNP